MYTKKVQKAILRKDFVIKTTTKKKVYTHLTSKELKTKWILTYQVKKLKNTT